MNLPQRITIEPTNHCKRACEFCPRRYMKDEQGFMNDKEFCDLIDQVEELKIPTVLLHWRGESIFHTRFKDFVLYARPRVERLEISTGLPMWSKKYLNLVPYFDLISISVHDVSCLELLREMLDRRTRSNPEIQLTAVEGESTVEEIRALRTSVDRVKIKKRHTRDGKWGVTGDAKRRKPEVCPRIGRDLVIGWNGRVSRCCVVWDTEPHNAFELGITGVMNLPHWTQRREGLVDSICASCDQMGEWTEGEVI